MGHRQSGWTTCMVVTIAALLPPTCGQHSPDGGLLGRSSTQQGRAQSEPPQFNNISTAQSQELHHTCAIGNVVPIHRFTYFVHFRDKTGDIQRQDIQDICSGVLFKKSYVLTLSTCASSLGPSSIAVVNGTTDVHSKMSELQFEVEWIKVHPGGKVRQADDVRVAVVKLHGSSSVPTPTLAAPGYDLIHIYPNRVLLGLDAGGTLLGGEFMVVWNNLCEDAGYMAGTDHCMIQKSREPLSGVQAT
ncbi:unnamed protein product [Ostreobium quekettii]|uniref:Peptidase S1 domain-containing protein n=1 Tax=Ostreobium quekettii TaxID=121088 RepID=A0A8S1J1D1_9CHLO|nr:unnamed protein product [Ostreobium quekettii]